MLITVNKNQVNVQLKLQNILLKKNQNIGTHWRWGKEFARSSEPKPSAWSTDEEAHTPSKTQQTE